jgi:uncharacterized protein
VGPHLANAAAVSHLELFYWREANREVDFVVRVGRRVTAIGVKSGRNRGQLRGMDACRRAFDPDRVLLVGDDGIPLEEFLSTPVSRWVGAAEP